MIHPDFYIYCDKFQRESDKALDWFIKSWSLKGTDKKIAELYKIKHEKKALEYLNIANKFLQESSI